MQTISRKRNGKHFSYYLGNEKIEDSKTVDRIKSLAIPPAWEKVEISKSNRSKIQAKGYDSAGRLQYIYSPEFRAKQEEAKFQRILSFAQALPKMRRTTEKHLEHRKLDKDKVMACIVRLMDEAYFRVGNDIYAKENQSYGITTLRSKHADVSGDTILFDFTGKSGQRQKKKINDRKLAKIVKKLDELPGYELFKYYDDEGVLQQINSKDVNDYIKRAMGQEFTAKDF